MGHSAISHGKSSEKKEIAGKPDDRQRDRKSRNLMLTSLMHLMLQSVREQVRRLSFFSLDRAYTHVKYFPTVLSLLIAQSIGLEITPRASVSSSESELRECLNFDNKAQSHRKF